MEDLQCPGDPIELTACVESDSQRDGAGSEGFLMRTGISCIAALALLLLAGKSAAADSVADFYRGRTINYYLATTAGGSWDVYLRVLISHWSRHIPGEPGFVLQYQPGGGGAKTLEYMSAVAARDGSAIATPLPTSLLYALLNPGVSYQPQRFRWIGNMARTQDVISVWHEVPV